MDLNHGTEDNKPYPYIKAEAANGEFVSTFEELLREVWIGIENVNNQSGAKPTDDAKIADLAEKLHDMLISRRQGGNLSPEEFMAVSTLSWFHLTLDTGTLTIIKDLRAEAASPGRTPVQDRAARGFARAWAGQKLLRYRGQYLAHAHPDRDRPVQRCLGGSRSLHTRSWRRTAGRHAEYRPALVDDHRTRDEGAQGHAGLNALPDPESLAS